MVADFRTVVAELKRRNVYRVGVAYAIVAWPLIEVARTAFSTLQLSDWKTTIDQDSVE